MTDIMSELTFHLSNPNDTGSLQFLDTFSQSNPGDFLVLSSQIILHDSTTVELVRAAIVHIGRITRPSLTRPAHSISSLWQSLADSLRLDIKRALFRCLMFPDQGIVNGGGFALALLAEIEGRRVWPDLLQTIEQLYLGSKSNQYSPLGVVRFLIELLGGDYLKHTCLFPARRHAAVNLIYTVGCEVITGAFDDATRKEAADLLAKAMRFHSPMELADSSPIFAALGTAASCDGVLHRAVFGALSTYFCEAHEKLTEAHVQGLLELTEACLNSGDMGRVIDALDAWTALASHEFRRQPQFALACIPTLFDPVFRLIGLDAHDNVDDAEWRVSWSARNCVKRLRALAEAEVCELLRAYAEAHFGDSDEVTILRVLVGMQLLAESRVERLSAFLHSAFGAVLGLTTAPLPKLAMAAFAVVQSLFTHRNQAFASEDVYNAFCSAVHRTLAESDSPDVIERAAKVARSFFYSCYEGRTNRFLATNWAQILALLAVAFQNRAAGEAPRVVTAVYEAIGALVRALPDDGAALADEFAGDLVRQLQAAFAEDSPVARARRAGIAVVVGSLCERFQASAVRNGDAFAALLFQADDDDPDVLLALGAVFFAAGDRLDEYAQRAIEVAVAVLQRSSRNLVAPACGLAGDVIQGRHRQLMGIVFGLVDLAYQLILQYAQEEETIMHVLMFLARLLFPANDQNFSGDVLGEISNILLPVRRQIMIMLANLRPHLRNAAVNVASQMMADMLRIYHGIAEMYDHEAVEVNGRKRPGEFLAEFMDDYRKIIQTGYHAELKSDRVLNEFTEYLSKVITVFRSFQNFNIKIHAKEFSSYIEWAQDSDNRWIKIRAGNAKYLWDHS